MHLDSSNDILKSSQRAEDCRKIICSVLWALHLKRHKLAWWMKNVSLGCWWMKNVSLRLEDEKCLIEGGLVDEKCLTEDGLVGEKCLIEHGLVDEKCLIDGRLIHHNHIFSFKKSIFIVHLNFNSTKGRDNVSRKTDKPYSSTLFHLLVIQLHREHDFFLGGGGVFCSTPGSV